MLVRFFTEHKITCKKRYWVNVYQCRREIAQQFRYPQRIPVIFCFVTLSIIYRLDFVKEIDLWIIIFAVWARERSNKSISIIVECWLNIIKGHLICSCVSFQIPFSQQSA